MFGGHPETVRQPLCDCPDATELRALFHDLVNQLASFACILESAAGASMSAAMRCHILTLRTHTERMLTILRDSVDPAPRPERVDVRALVTDVVSVANAHARTAVRLQPGAPRWLRTYPAAVWRAIANVVDNAVRAAGPEGAVQISLRDRPPMVGIEVLDDGPGFGRAPAGSASLGLAITRSLATRCAGNVQILPVAPHGVRVRLEFRDLDDPDLMPANDQHRTR